MYRNHQIEIGLTVRIDEGKGAQAVMGKARRRAI